MSSNDVICTARNAKLASTVKVLLTAGDKIVSIRPKIKEKRKVYIVRFQHVGGSRISVIVSPKKIKWVTKTFGFLLDSDDFRDDEEYD